MFFIPSALELYTRTYNAFLAYAALDASLPLNNVRPTAKVFAGHSSEIFGRMDYIGQQAFVLLADELYLPKHAEQYNIPRKPAIQASGNAAVVATDEILIPISTLFTRADGVQYASTAATSSAAGGTLIVPIISLEAGKLANSVAGTELVIGAGVTGNGADTATAAVDSNGIVNGDELEDIEAWRGRILFRLRYPPHGGAPSDYVMWGTAVPGVTRVFVERLYAGPGTVRVFPIFDDYFANQGGIATSAYITAVADAIMAQAPATALVLVAAPLPLIVDVAMTGLTPYTQAVKQAVIDELRDTFRRLGAVSGGDKVIPGMSFLAVPQIFSRSWIWQAVANASGEQRHVLTQPSADITVPSGSIPVLGSISMSA